MNTHKNARLTYLRRLEMVQDITKRGLSASQAALAHGVSAVTARKWLGRYLTDGAAGLFDKSSRPELSPRAIDPSVALTIVELRRKLLLQSRIASYTGVSKATVNLVNVEKPRGRFATFVSSFREVAPLRWCTGQWSQPRRAQAENAAYKIAMAVHRGQA
jgi:transposase-like protein